MVSRTNIDTVVVGGGPRSTGLIAAYGRLGRPRRIAIVDPLPDGAGAIWRASQSPNLLANTIASRIVIADEQHGGFVEWCSTSAVPSALAEEAEDVGPHTFPSRRLVGAYLRSMATFVDESVNPDTEVIRISARVRRVHERRSGFDVTVADSDDPVHCSAVVVATGVGHTDLSAVDTRDQRRTVPLREVPPGASVHVSGLGLTFHDVVSMFTEDRGGVFKHRLSAGGQQRWVYVASGAEPRISATSRSGLPLLPKRAVERGVSVLPLSQVAVDNFSRCSGDAELVIAEEIRRQLCHAGLKSDAIDALGISRSEEFDVNLWIAQKGGDVDTADTAFAGGVVVETLQLFASLPGLTARQLGSLERVGARATSGPPPERFRKLDALIRGGIVRVVPPGFDEVAEWRVRAYASSPPPPCEFVERDGAGWALDFDRRVVVDKTTRRCILANGRSPRISLLGATSSYPLVAGLPSPSTFRTFEWECESVVAGLEREPAVF